MPDYATGSSYSSTRYYTIDPLLIQLGDNTSNAIDASDIRDSVYSLWTKIEDVQTVASQSLSGTTVYTNSNIVPITVGGIAQGTSFSGTYSMQQMWDLLLYPYIAPGASLSLNTSTKQFGDSTGGQLIWTATVNTNTVPNGNVVVQYLTYTNIPTLPPYSGTINVVSNLGTHSVSPVTVSETNTFTMSVTDQTSISYPYTTTTNATATLTWMNRMYWGKIDLSSIGNPDLTTNPGSASLVSSYLSAPSLSSNSINKITALVGAGGAGVGTGSALATSKNKTYTGMDGTGQHLIFAFPNLFGTPIFTVNGLSSTAFTKVKSNVTFKNELGFTGTTYDVWVSNTLQNSSLNIVIS